MPFGFLALVLFFGVPLSYLAQRSREPARTDRVIRRSLMLAAIAGLGSAVALIALILILPR